MSQFFLKKYSLLYILYKSWHLYEKPSIFFIFILFPLFSSFVFLRNYVKHFSFDIFTFLCFCFCTFILIYGTPKFLPQSCYFKLKIFWIVWLFNCYENDKRKLLGNLGWSYHEIKMSCTLENESLPTPMSAQESRYNFYVFFSGIIGMDAPSPWLNDLAFKTSTPGRHSTLSHFIL